MEEKNLRKLIVFYSLEGSTRFIAQSIGAITQGDILELKPVKDIKSKGFMKFVRGGFQVLTGKKPQLMPIDKDPNDYDVIFLGTPIWASRYTPAVNSFLDKNPLRGKKIAFFCCHGGGGNGEAFNMLKDKLKENEILGEIEFKEPLKDNKEKVEFQLKEWIDKILK